MPKNNIGRDIIPLIIENNSGSPASLYMFGTFDRDNPKRNSYWLSNLNGDCTVFKPNTPPQAYGLPLETGKNQTFLPQLDGIRIYISIGSQLVTGVSSDGYPDTISADTKTANYDKLWDFVEASWQQGPGVNRLNMNPTQVDALGLAFKLEHVGLDPADNTKSLTVVNGFDSKTARADILRELGSAGAIWKSLIVANGKRALMPLKSMDLGVFPKSQLDGYISQVSLFYLGGAFLTFNYVGVNYKGVCSSTGAFTFTPDKAKDADGNATSTYKIQTPTTRQCYANIIVPSPNDGVGGAICAALGASYLRSTLVYYPAFAFPVPQDNRKFYYTKDPVCEYARIIHKYGIDNHAFCYGYDEVAGDAGENRDVDNPIGVKLTVHQA